MPLHRSIIVLSEKRSSWNSLSLLFLLVFVGVFVGHLSALLIFVSGIEKIAVIGPQARLLMMQALVASSAFIAVPLFYWRFLEKKEVCLFFQWRKNYTYPILLTLSLAFSLMVVNTWFIQWNVAVKLPSWLKAFEIWAQAKEAEQQRLTTLLTTFHTLPEFLVGIVVIGLIPAVGEELLFRGLVQNLCHKLNPNMHLAIGASALIFSITHLQFYGLVPRFLLGVLFGYLYWWTRDLIFPMAAHLFNNAFTLLLLFLHQQGSIEQDLNSLELLPCPVLVLFVLLVVAFSILLQRQAMCKQLSCA